MIKPKRSTVLCTALFIYTAVLAIFIYPFFSKAGMLFEYFCLIGGCVFLTLLLIYLFRRREKNN
ncbi:hypothetical protein D0T53_02025 [Dysgonomonas sp. 216]|uniref:hypothetical protein n=1 Tax=Dysgonomonas sp. 216 TaxID=2302934 RepID=UPI0013D17D05|nr:hypothetical protein [Dysgonomonas sp. 216]NDW17692.1 hypothetical protein [Dysgonomonas sp. 216]